MNKEVHNKKITGKNPFIADSPSTKYPSSMTTKNHHKSIAFRPNNYRRQIEVKTKDNSTIKKITSTIHKAKLNNHTKIISIKDYEGITIQYFKNNVIGIYSQPKIGKDKLTYLIERNTTKELEKRLGEIRKEIEEKIDFALNKFVDTFKIRLQLKKPFWIKRGYEDWVKGEEVIDSIPRDTIIHDTYFKKVYPEGIEFISNAKGEEPTVHLKNYIKNRAIEDHAPEIANEINNIHNTIQTDLNPILVELSHQIETHLAVQHSTLDLHRDMKNTLKDISGTFKQNTPNKVQRKGFTAKEMQLIKEFKEEM